MKLKNFYLLAFYLITLLALSFTAKAQLDPNFGTNGVTSLNVSAADKPVKSFLLPDGKILVVNNGGGKISFVRFNQNGTPDASYGTNGIVNISIPSPLSFSLNSAMRQSNGKIVLVGSNAVIRYNENGTLDTTFSDDGFHTPNVDQNAVENVVDVVQQPDGRIVVAGTVSDGESAPFYPYKIFLVRYEQNGLLDPTFGNQYGFIINSVNYPAISELVLQSDGKFLTVPQKEKNQDEFYFDGAVQRFNSNGTFDNSFAPIYIQGNKIRSFKLLRDDSFLVAENTSGIDSLLRSDTDMTISRYTSNGILDLNFGTNGKVKIDIASAMPDEAFAIAQQTDGKIVISGGTNIEPNRSAYFGMNLTTVRLTANGSIDGKYLVTNLGQYILRSVDPFPYKGQVLIQPDGKIITVNVINGGTGEDDLLLTRTLNVPMKTYRFHGIPYSFLNYYYSNASLFRPSNRNWYFNTALAPVTFGDSQDILAPSDFLGDFRTDVAVFRPSEGTWYIARPNSPTAEYVSLKWGRAGDIPMPRDYNGNGKSDPAVFRPSDGNWYIKFLDDNSHTIQHWGMNGDKPVAADYDGDGIDDIAVWRPSTGMWYVKKSSDGQPIIVKFGLTGDIPVQEDYDGDGKCDIAVWRPSTGVWYIWRTTDNNYTIFQWGISTDIPTPSDFDGDKKIDIGVWRPNNRNWYLLYSGSNTFGQFLFGLSSDIPTQGRN